MTYFKLLSHEKTLFLFLVLCQSLYVEMSIAQNVTVDTFVCIDITQDSILKSSLSQKSARVSGIVTNQVNNVLNSFLQRQNTNFTVDNETILYDSKGNSHFRYDVKYKGIPVHNYQYTIHSADDTLNTITGLNLFSDDISVIPSITASEAIEFAKTNLPAQKYFWEDAELEEMIKHITGDVSASYYPSPELVVFKDAQQLPVLSYRMELSASIPLFSYEVFISAMDVLLFRQAKLI